MAISSLNLNLTAVKVDTVKAEAAAIETEASSTAASQASNDSYTKSTVANTNTTQNATASLATSTDTASSSADNAELVTSSTTSSLKYTAAEIAEYDLDGDGEISAYEEARMLAKQAEEKSLNGGQLAKQAAAKDAYETAKTQLLYPEVKSLLNYGQNLDIKIPVLA